MKFHPFLAFVFLWLLSVIFVPCAVGLNCVRIASNLQLRCNRNICKDGEMLTLKVEQLERNKGGVYGHLLGIKLCCKLALWLQDIHRTRRRRRENCSVVLLQEK